MYALADGEVENTKEIVEENRERGKVVKRYD